MSSLNITIPHKLPKEEAVDRIKSLLHKLKTEQAKYIQDVKEDWEGEKADFQFSAQGFDVSGMITVTENEVTINGKLPFALSFFKGKIESVITKKAEELLA